MVLKILRRVARGIGAALLLLFAVFVIGEGLPPLTIQSAALGMALLGLVAAWFSDLAGGLLILGGMAAFYALNFSATGRLPGGWVFPLMFVPGVLLLAGFAWRQLSDRHGAAHSA